MFTLELEDGGCLEYSYDDQVIRYRDEHGNTEGVWEPGQADYNKYRAMLGDNLGNLNEG